MIHRRRVLQGLLAAPLVVAAANIMPVRAIARLCLPTGHRIAAAGMIVRSILVDNKSEVGKLCVIRSKTFGTIYSTIVPAGSIREVIPGGCLMVGDHGLIVEGDGLMVRFAGSDRAGRFVREDLL